MKKYSIRFLCAVCCVTTVCAQMPSPCPSVFKYEPRNSERDRWYGVVTLKTESELNGVWLRLIFDQPSVQLGNWFGEIKTTDNKEYLIKNPQKVLKPNEPLPLRFYVKYQEGGPIPSLIAVRLNARTVCPDPKAVVIKQPPPSPCPDVFQYEPRTQPGEWYGTVTLRTDEQLAGVWLRLNFDHLSNQLASQFGEVKRREETGYLVANRNHVLKPGEELRVRFSIKYNQTDPVPELLTVRLNGRTLCSASGAGTQTPTAAPGVFTSSALGTTQYVPPLNGGGQFTAQPPVIEGIGWATLAPPETRPSTNDEEDFFIADFRPNRKPIIGTPAVNTNVQCGRVVVQPTPLITHGQRTIEGQWPWHAALYHSKGIDLTYICGASLISTLHVITVAHCVCRKQSAIPLTPDSLVIYLGKYYLRKWSSKGIQDIQVNRIFVHREYDAQNFSNDIAVVRLAKPAQITDWVRPVCLWQDSIDLRSVLERPGTVVGWGYDETGRVTERLTQAQMPVVTQQTCIWSYPEFFSRFTSDKTYCAGFRNGTSVCNGDSGGGMVFPKQGATATDVYWELRGLVSISVALQNQFVCDASHYVVFTDVAKYLDWVRAAMNS